MIRSFFDALRLGQELTNAQVWKNRALLMNTLAPFIVAVLAIAKGFGYDLGLSQADVEALAGGVVGVLALVNGLLHVTTSSKVGLPPRGAGAAPAAVGPSEPDGDPEDGPAPGADPTHRVEDLRGGP